MKIDIDSNKIWGEYSNGRAYLQTIGLLQGIPKFVDYYEGRQWPKATEATKNLPRPVVNITKFISRNIKSGVLNTPVKVIFTAEDGSDTKILNDWHEYMEAELKMPEVDRKAFSSGVKKGTYIYHYYWDNDKQGKDAKHPGGLNVERIDTLNFIVSNPLEEDEQKQKWIIIPSREELDAVKEKVIQNGGDPDIIMADQSESPYMEEEQQGTQYVTVLTRYFRHEGEVYVIKSTRGAIIHDAKPIKPDIQKALKDIKGIKNEDEANTGLASTAQETTKDSEDKFNLYPIVVGVFEERENSIYGIGLVEDMIENQNIINRDLAYYQKARRDMALGGWMKKRGALAEGESITNAPDQVITDNSAGSDWGIKRLDVGNIPSDNLNFVDMFVGLIRTTTGATEVMSGEVLGKNMSGAAIAQLQTQAQQPLEDYRQRFWYTKQKQALVMFQFYKFYYEPTEFYVKKKKETIKQQFDPNQLYGKKFDVIATAGQGAMYSELSTIQTLDSILQSKVLENPIVAKTYINMLPEKVLGGYKDDIIEMLNEQEQSRIATLARDNENMKQQLLQAAEIISGQDEIVKKGAQMNQEIKRLNELIISMSTEYITAMQQASQVIEQSKLEVDAAKQDATLFANKLNQYMGTGGNKE